MASTTPEDAGAHAYLGELEDVAHPCHSYYPDDAEVILPLIYLRDIVLFPGDELPLRMLSDSSLGDFRQQLSGEDALLAVLPPDQSEQEYGTTVRIEKFSVEAQGATVTGTARQRFRLKRQAHFHHGSNHGTWGVVQILPQVRASRLPFDQPHWPREFASPKLQSRSPAVARRTVRRLRQRQSPAYWPRSVYELYDARVLVSRLQHVLLSGVHVDWFRHPPTPGATADDASTLVYYLAESSERQDPNQFAYWLAGNLPLDTAQRLGLLRIDSTVQLLRHELTLLATRKEKLLCVHCGCFLADTREIFSMTTRGDTVGGTFVNPGGYVFQLLTLRTVNRAHVFEDNQRSTQDSWFAGYAWSITHCNVCYSHLGWRFDHLDEMRSPASFYGFRRDALTQLTPGGTDTRDLFDTPFSLDDISEYRHEGDPGEDDVPADPNDDSVHYEPEDY